MPVTGRTRHAVLASALLALTAAACDAGGGPRVADTGSAEPTGEAGSIPPRGAPSVTPTPTGEATPTTAETDPGSAAVGLEAIGSGFDGPVVVLPARGSGLLVAEQPGRIRLLRDGEVTTYLDITDRVVTGDEQGLLGAVLPPDPGDGRILLHYSGAGGRTTLSSFEAGPDAADPASERILLTVDQPAANHNGGQLVFGPDGYLYLGLGDGGGADDTFGNGQDPSTLLGTILRLDITGPREAYDIPPDNPFADGRDGAPEVWAYGLRNPYRLAFGAGRLFVADVGQDAVEEINAVPADAAGRNYGWPLLEGPVCFAEPDCDPAGTTLPVTSYRHEETGGCAVIGGGVYAGEALPALAGWYVYSDRCAGFVRALRIADGGGVEEVDLTDRTGVVPDVRGFGLDRAGEFLLLLDDGRILRLVPA